MTTELRIEFDGANEALREHRLSVTEFARALAILRVGLRRAARKMERGVDIDLELKQLEPGSAIPTFVVRVIAGASLLLDVGGKDVVAEKATANFMMDVQAEARGEARNFYARRFLAAIPSFVSWQRYTVHHDGAQVIDVPLGEIELVQQVTALPQLRTVSCAVLGVQFAPGTPRVELLVEGKRYWCDATEKQVERALVLRGASLVQATIVGRRVSWRLVALRDHVYVPPPPQERTRLIAEKWSGVLARLAS